MANLTLEMNMVPFFVHNVPEIFAQKTIIQMELVVDFQKKSLGHNSKVKKSKLKLTNALLQANFHNKLFWIDQRTLRTVCGN